MLTPDVLRYASAHGYRPLPGGRCARNCAKCPMAVKRVRKRSASPDRWAPFRALADALSLLGLAIGATARLR